MKLNKVYVMLGTARAMVLLALIALFMCLCVKSYCYTFEMDYSGPGSEYERSTEQYRDRENQDSAERCGRGEGSERDQERSEQYRDDHGV